MKYNEKFEDNMKKYESLLSSYKKSLSDSYYAETVRNAPFDFLIGMHTYEALELFNTADESSEFYIASLKEALALYNNVVAYRKRIGEVLEKANAIVEVSEAAKALNDFVEESPYLPSSNTISYNESLAKQAEEILKKFPNYKNLYTKKFKTRFLESCLSSFNKEDLRVLIGEGIIRADEKANDLDMLKMVGDDHYMENLAFICEELHHKELVKEQHKVSLKGVTFKNDDGESRQNIIKEIANEQKSGKKVELKATAYEFTPEVGKPEPAVRVDWHEKLVGHVGKDVVADINSRYTSPQYKVELVGITGGEDGLSYGCDVMLTVVATPTMVKSTSPTQDAPNKDQDVEK